MKYLPAVVIAVVAAAVVAGLYFVGSPRYARQQRFDDRRVNDLSTIQYQVFAHWEQKGGVPASLAELGQSSQGYVAPSDPETSLPYEYNRLSDDSYQLCAEFAFGTSDQYVDSYAYPARYKDPYYLEQTDWSHGQGRTCFTRTIDRVTYRKDHPQSGR